MAIPVGYHPVQLFIISMDSQLSQKISAILEQEPLHISMLECYELFQIHEGHAGFVTRQNEL